MISWPNRLRAVPDRKATRSRHARAQGPSRRKAADAGQALQASGKVPRLASPRGVGQGEMGLSLRRRQGRGPRRHARPARRQGRGPRRDGQSRPAGAARLHHHHRGLHALSTPTARRYPEGPAARRSMPRSPRSAASPARASATAQSAARLGALGRARVDAGHDGHRAQSRPQRRDRRGAGAQVGRPALRLRLLSPLHHDVFRRGARHRPPPLRGDPRRPQGPERLHARHRSVGRRLGRARASATRSGSRRSTASRSRRIRTSSSGARSARCSAPG